MWTLMPVSGDIDQPEIWVEIFHAAKTADLLYAVKRTIIIHLHIKVIHTVQIDLLIVIGPGHQEDSDISKEAFSTFSSDMIQVHMFVNTDI